MPFNPFQAYWLADDGRVYSAPAQKIVDVNDAGYQAFRAAGGNTVSIWPRDNSGAQTNAALLDVIGPYGLSLDGPLVAYAAAKRYAKETGGTTINGVAMPTDRQTQAQLTGAYAFAQQNSGLTVQWKLADGTFVALTAAQIIATAIAVATFVQAAFATEASVVAGIKASPPTITSKAQIDAAFA